MSSPARLAPQRPKSNCTCSNKSFNAWGPALEGSFSGLCGRRRDGARGAQAFQHRAEHGARQQRALRPDLQHLARAVHSFQGQGC